MLGAAISASSAKARHPTTIALWRNERVEPGGTSVINSRASEPDRDERLDGWKAIAAHLGRSVRTVQRWEFTEGLPVHRHPHQKQASAWGYKTELDQWSAERRHLTEPTGQVTASNTEVVAADADQDAARGMHHWVSQRAVPLLALGLVLVATMLVANRVPADSADTPSLIRNGRDTDDTTAYEAFATAREAYLARRYDDALDSAHAAISRDPQYASAWIVLSKTYARMVSPRLASAIPPSETTDRMDRASARALELAPSSAESFVAQALAARARRDVSAWREYARRATEIDPTCAEAHAVLADSYSAQLGFACDRDRNPELADAYYQSALELDPNLEAAQINRAQNLAYLGRYEECAKTLTPLIDKSGDRTALAVRSRCFLIGNDLFSAARDVQRLIADPSTPESLVLLHRGWLRIEQGDRNEGIRDLEALTELKPTMATELSVAEAYADVGDGSRAADHLGRAFARDASCARAVAAAPSFRAVRQVPEVTATLASYGVR